MEESSEPRTGFFPDVGALQKELNDKFDILINRLDQILAELKRQGGGTNDEHPG